MPLMFKRDRVLFTGMVTGDDAETLLAWLLRHPKGKIDLRACTHLQPANLQVLMAAKRPILAMPEDQALADWLDSALNVGK